ncbi:hypothetical protein V7201_19435, partial [Bacillus sp. JJ1122]|uniref:hypothetical protein n=1 Tax=Bacillus sp. JJ1122 TaxID=3122951 RepID=UPI002FFE2794
WNEKQQSFLREPINNKEKHIMFIEKRAEKRRMKKQEKNYGLWDFVSDVLFWIPELIILPFRLLFLLFRFLVRSVFDSF